MKMKMAIAMGLALAGSVAMLYAERPMAAESDPAAMGMEKHPAMSQEVYACADCHVLSTKAEKDMTAQHLLGVKDGEALLCACGPGCKCDAKGVKDGKCACGKEVKKMSAKGLYVCPMGCPMVSDAAGKCPGCGMELKKVE